MVAAAVVVEDKKEQEYAVACEVLYGEFLPVVSGENTSLHVVHDCINQT